MRTIAAADHALLHFLPGETDEAKRLRAQIALINERVKQYPKLGRSILLTGETGVGKNYTASVIAAHAFLLDNPREWPADVAQRPSLIKLTMGQLKVVNLPSLPNQLVASELFGHKKGAFTDAREDRRGAFAAECSHLLLDEIGDINLDVQVQLLQVLQDGSYFRVGGQHEEPSFVEPRLLLATNRRLESLVRAGQFREDLYWRMHQLVIEVPPLRERREQIPELARNLVTRIRGAHGVAEATELSAEDIEWATKQEWRGNVRELERLLWRWVFDGGTGRLSEIQKRYPEVDFSGIGTPTIEGVVRARVETALREGHRLAPAVGEFLDSMTEDLRRGFVQAHDELSLDSEQLGRLFDDGKKAAKRVSEWRGGLRKPDADSDPSSGR